MHRSLRASRLLERQFSRNGLYRSLARSLVLRWQAEPIRDPTTECSVGDAEHFPPQIHYCLKTEHHPQAARPPQAKPAPQQFSPSSHGKNSHQFKRTVSLIGMSERKQCRSAAISVVVVPKSGLAITVLPLNAGSP